jgi:enamine deaminase RidA (YjgF/YER057c/UK114 family)
MKRCVATLLFVLGISAVFVAFSQGQTPSQTERRAIDPPTKPTDSPVSLGMLVGDTLYISGRVGLDPKTGKVPDNLDDEMKDIFDDFKAVPVQANMTMDDLGYVEVSTSDLSLYDKIQCRLSRSVLQGLPRSQLSWGRFHLPRWPFRSDGDCSAAALASRHKLSSMQREAR